MERQSGGQTPIDLENLSPRERARITASNSLFEEYQTVRMLAQNGVINENLHKNALNSYKRQLKQFGMMDLFRDLGPLVISPKEAEKLPLLLIDRSRMLAQFGGSVKEVDDIAIEAVELLSSGEFVPSRELIEIAKKNGIKGNYPTRAVLSRLNRLFKENMDVLEDYEETIGKSYKLSVEVKFVENEIREESKSTTPRIKAEKEKTVKKDETSSEAKKPLEIAPSRALALLKLARIKDITAEEIVTTLGPAKNGRKLTTFQAASALEGALFVLYVKTKQGKLDQDEQILMNTLNSVFADENGKISDNIKAKISSLLKVKKGQEITPQEVVVDSVEKPMVVGAEKEETEKTSEEELGIFFDPHDLGIVSNLVLSRMGVFIRNSDGERKARFGMPVEVMDIARVFERVGKNTPIVGNIDEKRNEAIEKITKLVSSEDISIIQNQDIRAKQFLMWLQFYCHDNPYLAKNFEIFLRTRFTKDERSVKYMTIDEFDYLVEVKKDVKEDNLIRIPPQELKKDELIEIPSSREKVAEKAQAEIVIPEPVVEVAQVVEIEVEEDAFKIDEEEKKEQVEDKDANAVIERTPLPYEVVKLPEKSVWADFKRRDERIEGRIAEIVEEVIVLGLETIPAKRLVAQLQGVTDRLQDMVIKNKIVKYELKNGIPNLTLVEAIKLAYYCRYGKNTGLRQRDYSKLDAAIELKIKEKQKNSPRDQRQSHTSGK